MGPELLAIPIARFRLTIDNVEDTILELDPFRIAGVIEFFSFKLL